MNSLLISKFILREISTLSIFIGFYMYANDKTIKESFNITNVLGATIVVICITVNMGFFITIGIGVVAVHIGQLIESNTISHQQD